MLNRMGAMRIDLHVHTDASQCSCLSLDDIITHAAGLGLDGVCITDHHCMDALNHVSPGLQPNGMRLFVGQEYHCDQGDFLIFGPKAPLTPDLGAQQLLACVEQSGGVAIAAHPFREERPTAEFVIREGMCRIVESINGRNHAYENQGVDQWRKKYDLIECAGSDAHRLEELGKACTRFSIPVHTSDDLIYALKNGLCDPCYNCRP